MTTPIHHGTARPALSRADIEILKTYDRSSLFAALGSFDERGLTDEMFVLRLTALLDPARVPGLAEARAADDVSAILDVVARACTCPPGEVIDAREPAPAVRALADDVLSHRFTFYDERHQLPEDIDWDFNPGTAHWGHDLNRFSYLGPLTQAYLATGDPRYSRKAVDLILDWIAKANMSRAFTGTPYVFGSYLNNAIHCRAWAGSMRALLAHGQVTPLELARILKSLHDQLAYLEVVTNGHHGNWPTIGCQGMLGVLEVFPVFRDTDRIADYCVRTLAVQIDAQVLPDGVQDELTPHYHRVVINNLLSALQSLRPLGRELEERTMRTLRLMVHYQQQATVPDGSAIVAFNDSDPEDVVDLRERLTPLGLADLLLPAERLGPAMFPYAGVAFLRQRQGRGDLYLAFDAGPYGRAHQHEDQLGFWLFAYGRNFLVDPGRHLYDQSAQSYLSFLRSTAAHSTIRIDGQHQHSAGRRDTWIAQAPLDLKWHVADDEIRATGVYDLGYGASNAIAVIHQREIVFVRERCWVIFDMVSGEGEHLVESRFQFAPGDLQVAGNTVVTQYPDANLLLRALSTVPFADIRVEKGQEDPRGGWYSASYGRIAPAPALSLSVTAALPLRIATLLYPYRGVEAPEIAFTFDGETAIIRTAQLGEVRVTASRQAP